MLDIFLVQMQIKANDKAKNFEKVKQMVSSIRKKNSAGIIVLPEMFATGYLPLHPESAAENFCNSNAGVTANFLYKLAASSDCYVIGAGIQKKSDNTLLNHSSTYSKVQTDEFFSYNKQHLFFIEQSKITSDNKLQIFKLGNWRVAVTICFDLRFPELYRELTKKGANLIIVQAAWPIERISHWRILLQARAIENQLYIAAVNATGNGLGGSSIIINPKGEILAEADLNSELVLHAQISLDEQIEYRKKFPVLNGIV